VERDADIEPKDVCMCIVEHVIHDTHEGPSVRLSPP
jgi:hypothetical protein